MDLPLVGEWSEELVELRILRHDWHNILEPMGLLAWDHRLAVFAHAAGALLMVLAWAWGGWWLWHARRQARIVVIRAFNGPLRQPPGPGGHLPSSPL